MLFGLFFCSFAASGQDIHPYNRHDFKSLVLREYNYVYNDFNAKYFVGKVEKLVDMESIDSNYKATMIMWGLLLYNKVEYSPNRFQTLIAKIRSTNQNYFENLVIGNWRFKSDFSIGMVNEISTSKLSDTSKRIVFDGSTVNFFSNDTLVKKIKYLVKPRENSFEITKYNTYEIYFEGSNVSWGFSVEKTLEKTVLIIREDPNCECGCRLDYYEKLK